MRLPRSLQGRLLVLVLGLVTGVWIAVAIATWFDVRHELDELLDSHLAQAAALLVVQQMGDIEDGDEAVDAPTLHRYAPKVAFQIFHEGRLAMRSANAPVAPMAATEARFRSGFRTVNINGESWRVFAAEGAERDIRVYVGEQMESRMAILWAGLRSTLWPMLMALPLLALAVWWALHRGVAPLRALSAQLAERRPGEMHAVTLERAPTEIVPVVESLNGLLRRIGELLESERRFTADAAHELRTPIAAIRAQAQVAIGEHPEGGGSRALHATLEGCDRASRVVDQILTLSRLESGHAVPLEPLDLCAVVRDVVAEMAPQSIGRNQSIALDAPDACKVRGDATLLGVLVRNLVDNAVRYSPEKANVRVTIAALNGRPVLSVEDSGTGMSDADISRLGARFFRVPGSDASGSGLGWSIVKRIASLHGADVRVSRSEGLEGLKVSVTFV